MIPFEKPVKNTGLYNLNVKSTIKNSFDYVHVLYSLLKRVVSHTERTTGLRSLVSGLVVQIHKQKRKTPWVFVCPRDVIYIFLCHQREGCLHTESLIFYKTHQRTARFLPLPLPHLHLAPPHLLCILIGQPSKHKCTRQSNAHLLAQCLQYTPLSFEQAAKSTLYYITAFWMLHPVATCISVGPLTSPPWSKRTLLPRMFFI